MISDGRLFLLNLGKKDDSTSSFIRQNYYKLHKQQRNVHVFCPLQDIWSWFSFPNLCVVMVAFIFLWYVYEVFSGLLSSRHLRVLQKDVATATEGVWTLLDSNTKTAPSHWMPFLEWRKVCCYFRTLTLRCTKAANASPLSRLLASNAMSISCLTVLFCEA